MVGSQALSRLLEAAQLLACVSLLLAVTSAQSQAIQAADHQSITQMEEACRALATPTCIIEIATPQTLALPAPHTIPPSLHLRFLPGGSWLLQGSDLTLANGHIEAPEDALIFPGPAHLHGLTEARPEWFAAPTPEGYPPLALALAYQSTLPMATIYLREASYLSPFFDPQTPGACTHPPQRYTSPRIFLGSRRPTVDNETTPTQLLAGSIIRGAICGNAPLLASHLGLDDGPYVVQHLFVGQPAYGIDLGHAGPVHQTKGTILTDIAVLTSNMPSQHSVIIEGQDDLTIDHLWLWTLGGTHGLVIKSSHATVRDFHCKGASSDCLIVKSDAATDNEGYAADVLLQNITISPLARPYDTAGIFIDSRWDTVHHLTMDHIVEDQTRYGIIGVGSLFYRLHDVTIHDWTATVPHLCLHTTFSRDISIEDFRCTLQGPPPGIPAFDLRGEATHLTNGIISCPPANPLCGGSVNDGIADRGRDNTFENLTGERLSGYLLRNQPRQNETASGLKTIEMGERTISPYRPPYESFSARLQRWIATLKPLLRILYTTVLTRWRLLHDAIGR